MCMVKPLASQNIQATWGTSLSNPAYTVTSWVRKEKLSVWVSIYSLFTLTDSQGGWAVGTVRAGCIVENMLVNHLVSVRWWFMCLCFQLQWISTPCEYLLWLCCWTLIFFQEENWYSFSPNMFKTLVGVSVQFAKGPPLLGPQLQTPLGRFIDAKEKIWMGRLWRGHDYCDH